ncbi:MAG TPA: helix-turn-helix domain-containing protein [Polyangia bacterium]|nr:helix-turn-helix domain-containing protein [Polyangia bacterium]
MAHAALETLHFEIAKLLVKEPAALLKGARLDRLTWRYLQAAMDACEGSVPTTARLLGIHRRTLERQLSSPKPSRKKRARSKRR